MITAKDAAKKLAAEIFDRIERDRMLIGQHIEAACEDALILFAAKQQPAAPPMPLVDACCRLVHLFRETPIRFGVPGQVTAAVDRIGNALRDTGTPV